MTGLDLDKCHIIEMACLITDDQLNVVAEGPDIIIHQSDEILDNMNAWCIEHHGKSGLTEAVRKSKISLQQAEMEMLAFVRAHTPERACPLAGNTVHADKRFLEKYMPEFTKHLHYRIVDVSTVKELCREILDKKNPQYAYHPFFRKQEVRRWYPETYKDAPRKLTSHRALTDIKESIEELKFYRRTIFS